MTDNQTNGEGPMRLVDRYLAAVAAQLPATSREDVVAELRDDLMTRIEVRQDTLGRDLSGDEVEAILREVGHPLVVAARYGSGPQSLIGPELFPWWMFSVKVGLMVLVGVTLLALLVKVVSGMDVSQAIGQGFQSLFSGGVTLIGLATLGGYIIERQAEKPSFITNWRVRDLGVFELTRMDVEGIDRAINSGAGAPESVRAARRQSMSPVARALSSAVAVAVMTAWWIGAIRLGGVPLDAWVVEVSGVDYTEAVRDTVSLIFWPVVGYGVARVLFDLFRAANSRAVRLAAIGDILLAGVRVAFYGWLILTSPISSFLGVPDLASLIERVRDLIQTGITTGTWSLSGVIVLILASLMVEAICRILISVVRLVTGRDRRLES